MSEVKSELMDCAQRALNEMDLTWRVLEADCKEESTEKGAVPLCHIHVVFEMNGSPSKIHKIEFEGHLDHKDEERREKNVAEIKKHLAPLIAAEA